MELVRENNNNLVNSEHQDDNSWCTVRSKKTKEKRSRKRLKSFESSLPPIFESVSDDEVYFSSSGDGSDDDANSLAHHLFVPYYCRSCQDCLGKTALSTVASVLQLLRLRSFNQTSL